MKESLIHRAGKPGGHDTSPSPARQLIISLAALLLVFTQAAEAAPAAQEILASARLRVSQQEIDVQGQLRENELVVPFRLTQTGPVVRYSFTNPDEALQMRLGESDSKLEEITSSGVDKVSGPEFDQKVRGTAITYEDLALKFIYWPKANVLGEDYINTRRVWKLELQPPGRESQYSRVFVWCEQQSGALMRMEGFDWNNRLVKRFEVVSAQKIEGRWFLKQMRVEQLDPASGKVQARTYLEIKK
jgi:hypothetical protein